MGLAPSERGTRLGSMAQQETQIPAELFYIRSIFFERLPRLATSVEVEAAFRLLRRVVIRAHLLAQGYGAPAGDAELVVLSVQMRSPLTILAELPSVIQYTSGVGALLLLGERIWNLKPRVQAKRELLEAMRAVARRQRVEAELYTQDLLEGRVLADRLDVLRELAASDNDLASLEPPEGMGGSTSAE